MKIRALIIIFCLSVFGSPLALSAQDRFEIISIEISDLLTETREGAYARVLDALRGEKLIDGWHVMPAKRAHNTFFKTDSACIAPASLELLHTYHQDTKDYVITVPFNMARGYVFHNMPDDGNSDKKTLGTTGSGVMHGIDHMDYEKVRVAGHSKLMELLISKRLDSAYVFLPDALQEKDVADQIKAFDGKVEEVWVGKDAIICKAEHANRARQLSKALSAWRTSGLLKELLGDAYLE